MINVAANVPVGLYEVRAIGKYGQSNSRVFMCSNLNQALEIEPNNSMDKASEVQLPVVVNGRGDRAADVDYFRFTASAGQYTLNPAEKNDYRTGPRWNRGQSGHGVHVR